MPSIMGQEETEAPGDFLPLSLRFLVQAVSMLESSQEDQFGVDTLNSQDIGMGLK